MKLQSVVIHVGNYQMRKANFFIIGAPKAGTTAMRDYLNQHPNIFMCNPKEPHFFSDDLVSYKAVKSTEEYNNLYSQATSEHKILGDASVFYLYSDCALKNLRQYNPDAKLLVMLRNPIDMVYSFHSQLLFSRQELIEDFEEAWNACAERKLQKRIPSTCTEPKLLYYDEIAKFYSQLQVVYNFFYKEQVKIILFKDFIVDTPKVFQEILEFLGLSGDEVNVNFEKVNEGKTYKFPMLGTLSQRPSKNMNHLVSLVKKVFGIKQFGLMEKIHQSNIVHEKRKELSLELRNAIQQHYSHENNNLRKEFNIVLD